MLDGRYRILERIAQGGMGVVYRAERVPVGRPVAVKFLHLVMADDPDARSRFERETRALSKLAHPHCVSIIDFGVAGSPYLVMDHVSGVTLRDLLDDGPLAVDESLTIARQLLAGLAHAHAQRIVHRDVKPANIMVSDEIGTGRHVRILDFGLARLREHGAALVTQASMAIGTPSYMAPEQTIGGEVDARTDVYAAGVVLFEMLTGRRPFVSDEQALLLEAHRSSPPPRLADVLPERRWPPGLERVVARALAKAPDDRWPSAVDFAGALDAIARGEVPTVAPARSRGGGRRLLAAVALVVASGAAAIAAVELRDRPRASPSAVGGGGPVADAAGALEGRRDDAVPMAVRPAGAVPDARADAPVDAPVDADVDAPADAGPDGGATSDAGPVDEAEIELAVEPVAPADPEVEPSQQPDDDETAPPAPAPPPARTVVAPARSVKEALSLVKRGHRDAALQGLRMLWKKQPRNAQLPYLLGNLYHDKKWWSVAMEHYQAAIARKRSYRSNSTIIRNVISALGSSKTRTKASWFLRKVIGAPARRHLQAAARRHASSDVRRRAAALLKR